MERAHCREFQAMSGAPVKKLPARAGVSLSRISVPDRGGEEVNVSFGDYNPRRPGRLSHHPLLAVLAEANFVLHSWFA